MYNYYYLQVWHDESTSCPVITLRHRYPAMYASVFCSGRSIGILLTAMAFCALLIRMTRWDCFILPLLLVRERRCQDKFVRVRWAVGTSNWLDKRSYHYHPEGATKFLSRWIISKATFSSNGRKAAFLLLKGVYRVVHCWTLRLQSSVFYILNSFGEQFLQVFSTCGISWQKIANGLFPLANHTSNHEHMQEHDLQALMFYPMSQSLKIPPPHLLWCCMTGLHVDSFRQMWWHVTYSFPSHQLLCLSTVQIPCEESQALLPHYSTIFGGMTQTEVWTYVDRIGMHEDSGDKEKVLLLCLCKSISCL